mmetsp:Transcript_5222/g.21301  ORF Transcript_5222/g.21301 Transcript_5222/m.21301 type:complete len:276 (+) Transcript_5222:699-1526(+)
MDPGQGLDAVPARDDDGDARRREPLAGRAGEDPFPGLRVPHRAAQRLVENPTTHRLPQVRRRAEEQRRGDRVHRGAVVLVRREGHRGLEVLALAREDPRVVVVRGRRGSQRAVQPVARQHHRGREHVHHLVARRLHRVPLPPGLHRVRRRKRVRDVIGGRARNLRGGTNHHARVSGDPRERVGAHGKRGEGGGDRLVDRRLPRDVAEYAAQHPSVDPSLARGIDAARRLRHGKRARVQRRPSPAADDVVAEVDEGTHGGGAAVADDRGYDRVHGV